MNLTRIQVPFSLPEPHFDDEATVVSARQVVPLGEARIQDRRRKVLAILPLLLAAAVCGALGALAVNYFSQRPSAPAVSQPSATSAQREDQMAPAPAPESAVAADLHDETAETSQPAGSSLTNDALAADTVEEPPSSKPKPAVVNSKKPSKSPDPKQLVRQRRVHPPSDQTKAGQNDQPKTRGAARIEDIFGGPNP